MGSRAQRDSPSAFEKVRNMNKKIKWEGQRSLGAESNTRLTAKKKLGSSVIQPHGTELHQQLRE